MRAPRGVCACCRRTLAIYSRGCCRGDYDRHRRAGDLDRHPSRRGHPRAEIAAEIAAGLSVYEVARAFGITVDAVQAALRRHRRAVAA